MSEGETESLSHVPMNARAGLEVMNAGKPLAALRGDPATILERLNAGESACGIAESLGISHVALYAWLLTHCPEEWRAVSAAKALTRFEKADADLNDPLKTPDNVSVTRSANAARLAQWSLERTFPKIYADAKNGSEGVTVQVLIQRDGSTAIQVQPGGGLESVKGHGLPVLPVREPIEADVPRGTDELKG